MDRSASMTQLDQLFRESAADLRKYFSHRHQGEETIRDLVQETFLQLAKSLESSPCIQCPRGYLFGIARRTSIALWKKQFRAAEVGMDDPMAENLAAPVSDLRIRDVKEIIRGLEPLQREVLELRFTYALSYDEIATALHIPVGTVRSRLHHAVATVRQKIKEDEL